MSKENREREYRRQVERKTAHPENAPDVDPFLVKEFGRVEPEKKKGGK